MTSAGSRSARLPRNPPASRSRCCRRLMTLNPVTSAIRLRSWSPTQRADNQTTIPKQRLARPRNLLPPAVQRKTCRFCLSLAASEKSENEQPCSSSDHYPPQETAIPPAQTAQLLSFGLVIEPANPEWRALYLALSNFVTPGPGRKLDFSQVHLMAKTIPPKHLSDFRNPGLLGKMNFRLGLNSWKLPWRLNCCRTRRTRNGCVANTIWR